MEAQQKIRIDFRTEMFNALKANIEANRLSNVRPIDTLINLSFTYCELIAAVLDATARMGEHRGGCYETILDVLIKAHMENIKDLCKDAEGLMP